MMNRRDLLKYGVFGLAGFAAGAGLTPLVAPGGGAACSSAGCIALPESLVQLADQGFLHAMPELSTGDLLLRLEQAGIYSKGCFNLDRLAEQAEAHRLVAFEGFYYTEPELMLYALVAQLQAS